MKLDPARHDWMHAPETQTVMGALGEGRFVGGAVRNALLGAPVEDIDIAVPMAPGEAMRRLEAAHVKVVPTGIAHGTLTAIVNDKIFEVTSLRRDVATDGRHALVVYTDDWAQDAARRDFTMNALYAAADGAIFDYGGGLEDLAAGRVRFVGDAALRIAEDYLRILRLFRFHAWYGRGEMDGEALHAAAAAKGELARLSGARVAKELLRLLECANPAPVLRLMAAAGILAVLLPPALQLPRLAHLTQIEAENLFAPDALLRLVALLPQDRAAAMRTGAALKLSNAQCTRLEDLATPWGESAGQLSARDVRRMLYRIGPARLSDRALLQWAGGSPTANALQWRMLLKMAENWEQPHFPLTGRAVMAAGVPEGPQVGRVLAQIEDWWVDGDFTADAAALAEKLKAVTA